MKWNKSSELSAKETFKNLATISLSNSKCVYLLINSLKKEIAHPALKI
jgi:hypothetical protein